MLECIYLIRFRRSSWRLALTLVIDSPTTEDPHLLQPFLLLLRHHTPLQGCLASDWLSRPPGSNRRPPAHLPLAVQAHLSKRVAQILPRGLRAARQPGS